MTKTRIRNCVIAAVILMAAVTLVCAALALSPHADGGEMDADLTATARAKHDATVYVREYPTPGCPATTIPLAVSGLAGIAFYLLDRRR